MPTYSLTRVALGKRSRAEIWQEELKNELDENRFANKRRQLEAIEALEFVKTKQEIVSNASPMQEIRQKVEADMK